MLIERAHTPDENGVEAWEFNRVRIELGVCAVLVYRNRTPIMAGLDDFQRRFVGDGRESVEAKILAGRLDISPTRGNK